MKKEIELAKRAVELAMLISQETTAHAWFEYSGHCDIIDATYAPGGYRSGRNKDDTLWSNLEYVANMAKPTLKNLQHIVDCFEFIYAVAERK